MSKGKREKRKSGKDFTESEINRGRKTGEERERIRYRDIRINIMIIAIVM